MLFKNEAGEILYSEGAHTARAGWNNIYLGEIDGTDEYLSGTQSFAA